MKKPNNKKDIDFEIMFKGQDGVVTSYKNEDEVVPKKKKKLKEGKIQSEETLEMLMNALKPQSAVQGQRKKLKIVQ